MNNHSLTLTLVLALSACVENPAHRESPTDGPHAAQAAALLTPPSIEATKPSNYPGLHNVVTYHEGLYSGSAPEGAEGFESLKEMGIRTIISVDGATPEVARAKGLGMRYVHLPITYSGMEEERKLEIARAVSDLPGPIYVHCHHGKHRSAGAAGAAAVTLGWMSPDEATARMKVSGTAPNYKGLYACVAESTPVSKARMASVDASFPEVSRPTGLTEAMVQIDHEFDSIKAIKDAGWKVPADHPDLVPSAVAGRLENLFREIEGAASTAARPLDFREWVSANRKNAQILEGGLQSGATPETLSDELKAMEATCKQCHARYRD